MQPCSLSTLQPCSLAALQPCNLAILQPCNLATLQSCNLATLQLPSGVGGHISFMKCLVIFSVRSRVAGRTPRQRRFSSVLTNELSQRKTWPRLATASHAVPSSAAPSWRRAGICMLLPSWESLFKRASLPTCEG